MAETILPATDGANCRGKGFNKHMMILQNFLGGCQALTHCALILRGKKIDVILFKDKY
jgi:hypothetical protein